MFHLQVVHPPAPPPLLCPSCVDPKRQVLASSKEVSKVDKVESRGPLKVNANAAARLALLKSRLFKTVCRRVCRSLLNKDRLLFALRLAQVIAWSL